MPRKLKVGWILLFGAAIGLNYLSSFAPAWVEMIYSRTLYPVIGQVLSLVTGLAPLSLSEVTAVALLVALPILVIYWFFSCWRQPLNWLRGPWRLLSWISVAYFCFMLLWGLNYHRLPFATIAHLPVQPSSVTELNRLCQDLLARANELRQSLPEDATGVTSLTGGKWRALSRANLGYKQLADRLPALAGRYGLPKGVYLSEPWSYTGIAGMYFPFTGEANVNMAVPAPFIPAAACHEMAHQRGFAREDEANYIAYLTCINHPDPEFQYSGVLLALEYASEALRAEDQAAYSELRQGFGPGLTRDLQAEREFWQRHSGPIERLTTNVNDKYLKSNLQNDGVQSYGRMVDLLLAEQRLNNR